jgi:hypothetical protein
VLVVEDEPYMAEAIRDGLRLEAMADAGVLVHVLRKMAGHGSLSTTQRYLHPDQQSFQDAGTALSAHLAERWSPNGPQLRPV